MSGKNQVTRARMTSRDGRRRALRLVRRIFAKPARSLAMLAAIGLVSGVSPQAATAAEPAVQNRIFTGCTFTSADLTAFTISDESIQLEASYILIYVRANPNDGQQIGTTSTYTGPVLCRNADTDKVVKTTETTPIPNSDDHPGSVSVDVLGTEEALHLQYLRNSSSGPGDPPGDVEKRVCHTVAGNTDCFFIQPLTLD